MIEESRVNSIEKHESSSEAFFVRQNNSTKKKQNFRQNNSSAENKNQTNKPQRSFKCFNCGGDNHYKRDCKAPKKKQTNKSGNESKSEQEKESKAFFCESGKILSDVV